MTDRDSGPIRTDADIVASSEAALRWEMSEEGELKRALWAAQAEINKACSAIADLYSTLCHGQWERQGMALSALVECVVSDVRAAHNKARHLKSQLDSAELSAQHHSEEAKRNLQRAAFAEKQFAACEAQRTREANVAAGKIKQLQNDLAAADDLLASYRAAQKGGE